MTHYQVLGVPKTASEREIREAFRAKARQLHPDRLIDASPREREVAAREMQVVNEAWRVLNDRRRRRRYDDSLEPAGTRHYADTTLAYDDEDDLVPVAGGRIPALQALPWVLLAALLALIFVFTAYAGPNDDNGRSQTTTSLSPTSAVEVGDCIEVSGSAVRTRDCGLSNDGQVVAEADSPADCALGTHPLLLPADDRFVCVADG